MSVAELQWLIGVSLTVVLSVAGIAAGAFRAMSARLDRQTEKLARAIGDGDDKLHERINRVRDDYVRRVDLDGHLSRFDKNFDEIRRDLKQLLERRAG